MMRVVDNVIDDRGEVQRSKGVVVVVYSNVRFFLLQGLISRSFKKIVTEK